MKAQFGAQPEETLKYPEWQKSFQDALMELDHAKLRQRVLEAESAISQRLQTLTRNPEHRQEREAIENAVSFLRVLKKEKIDEID